MLLGACSLACVGRIGNRVEDARLALRKAIPCAGQVNLVKSRADVSRSGGVESARMDVRTRASGDFC